MSLGMNNPYQPLEQLVKEPEATLNDKLELLEEKLISIAGYLNELDFKLNGPNPGAGESKGEGRINGAFHSVNRCVYLSNEILAKVSELERSI